MLQHFNLFLQEIIKLLFFHLNGFSLTIKCQKTKGGILSETTVSAEINNFVLHVVCILL